MTKIIQRHDTAANWTSINPVLAAGEMGVETDTNKFKFGDGATAWSGLAYAAGEGGSGSGTTLTSTDGTTTYSKLALGDTLSVTDTSTKELNKLTQTGGTLNSELEFTGASSAYLKMNEKYDLSTADSWEFQIKYKHNGGGTYPTIFGYASGSDFKTPSLIYQDGTLVLYLSSSGGSWNINSSGSGLVPQAGTIYYFKVGFTGSQYYVKYNTTGWSDEFTTQWTLNSTTKVYCSDYFMLMNLSLNSGYYNTGTMYLQDTALFINGSEAWRGAKIIPGDMILNTSSDAYTKAETDGLLRDKQDKLTAIKPITIKTDGTLIADLEMSGTIVDNGDGSYTNPISTAGKTNWVKITPALDCIYTSDWEIIIPFRWDRNSGEASQTLIGGTSSTFYTTIEENNFRVWYNSSGYAATRFLPTIGVKTWMKFKYTSGVLTISFSTDGVTYSNATSHSRSVLSAKTETYFFGGEQSWQENARGGMFTIFFNEIKVYKTGNLQYDGFPAYLDPYLAISANPATTTSLGVVQPDGTSITVSETGVISGQDVKTFTGYSDTGTLVLKSINGVLQWVAE